jgi:hypothetical protein
MSTDRLQLTLISDSRHRAQPLPPAERNESIELLARMLLALVHPETAPGETKESNNESR